MVGRKKDGRSLRVVLVCGMYSMNWGVFAEFVDRYCVGGGLDGTYRRRRRGPLVPLENVT